jgi:isopentenyl phosphate kinase
LKGTDLGRISLGGSGATDVTGGMAGKVHEALALAASIPGLEVRIFSGLEPGAVRLAILGDEPGTLIAP